MNAIDHQQLDMLAGALLTDAEMRDIIMALSQSDADFRMVGLIDKLMTQRRLVPGLMRAYSQAREADGTADETAEVGEIQAKIHHIANKLDAVYVSQFPNRPKDVLSSPVRFMTAARYLLDGQRIAAIKELRERFYLGLKEAKTLVDYAHPGSYTYHI